MNTTQNTTDNPLATGNINQLMIKFAVPSIIAMMVSAVYNIADQLFIGNAVGTLGNAATNIAFPLFYDVYSDCIDVWYRWCIQLQPAYGSR